MPTAQEEAQDPVAADAVYEEGTRLLIYGLRGLGLVSAVLGFCKILAATAYSCGDGRLEGLSIPCAAVCLALLLWWRFTLIPSWVRVPAENYAQHLFAALEKLPKSRGAGKKAGL